MSKRRDRLNNIQEANKNLLNEVGGNDIMADFGGELSDFMDKVLDHYEGRLSKTMVTGLLINTIQKIGNDKRYTQHSRMPKH